jgi:hypothetical protein
LRAHSLRRMTDAASAWGWRSARQVVARKQRDVVAGQVAELRAEVEALKVEVRAMAAVGAVDGAGGGVAPAGGNPLLACRTSDAVLDGADGELEQVAAVKQEVKKKKRKKSEQVAVEVELECGLAWVGQQQYGKEDVELEQMEEPRGSAEMDEEQCVQTVVQDVAVQQVTVLMGMELVEAVEDVFMDCLGCADSVTGMEEEEQAMELEEQKKSEQQTGAELDATAGGNPMPVHWVSEEGVVADGKSTGVLLVADSVVEAVLECGSVEADSGVADFELDEQKVELEGHDVELGAPAGGNPMPLRAVGFDVLGLEMPKKKKVRVRSEAHLAKRKAKMERDELFDEQMCVRRGYY